jgi:uncharacterized SAM-binding protein YcdF (DUF218 family)
MLYMAKFLYNSFLLPPGVFIIALFVLSIYLYRREKKASVILFVISFVLYAVSTPVFAGFLMRPLENSYKPPANIFRDAGAIVMLGGGATPDTPDMDGTGHLSGSATARLLTAVKLHNKTKLPVIVTGGKVYRDSGNEAVIARRQLIALGVTSQDIIAENHSRTTEENAIYTSRILKKSAINRVFLVTSAYHMRRAVACFKKSGVGTIPFPTDYTMSVQPGLYLNIFAPSYGGLNTTGTALHEYLGLLALKF